MRKEIADIAQAVNKDMFAAKKTLNTPLRKDIQAAQANSQMFAKTHKMVPCALCLRLSLCILSL